MTQRRAYVHLKPATMTACDITNRAYEQARKTWLCTGCCAPRPELKAIDVEIESLEDLKGHVLTFINGCGLGLVHQELLDWLPATAVSTDLWLGNIFDSEGRRVEMWKTFRGKHRLIVRGTKHAGYRRCDDCGQLIYFAMGKQYLFPAPDEQVILFESNYHGLIVPESLYKELPAKAWPLVTVETLPVVSEPMDSLGLLT